MHRPFAALGAGVPSGQPLASACCALTTTVTANAPSNANTANMAIITIVEFMSNLLKELLYKDLEL